MARCVLKTEVNGGCVRVWAERVNTEREQEGV